MLLALFGLCLSLLATAEQSTTSTTVCWLEQLEWSDQLSSGMSGDVLGNYIPTLQIIFIAKSPLVVHHHHPVVPEGGLEVLLLWLAD